ncbi:acyltransferase [Sulfurospirillum deleyianum]|uniref:Acetyltransferase n=1 Tax=Sulfurospirillum deleyianum (strain ATCC 51133 / DSM 6946 / 5175) TaxID=525898 RepID=D1B3X5_SULD5|nr:acyltransferase [Sulfurospirillum deleyianum]ACZ12795.1 acetyltransferase [Sulfurospirillum deleyianum DSM 6946]
MSINNFIFKVKRKLKHIVEYFIFQYPRILKYKMLSNCKNIVGKPIYNQPTQLLGGGTIVFGKNVNLGVTPSPYLYSGYGYIDTRNEHSKIVIGDDVWINNNFMITSEGEGIEIREKTLIGLNVEITDSDFHDLHPERRMTGTPKTAKVVIGKNVFIGSNVKILKGVTIGDNSVIANSSVVTKLIPENVIAGGYPAKVIRKLDI